MPCSVPCHGPGEPTKMSSTPIYTTVAPPPHQHMVDGHGMSGTAEWTVNMTDPPSGYRHMHRIDPRARVYLNGVPGVDQADAHVHEVVVVERTGTESP